MLRGYRGGWVTLGGVPQFSAASASSVAMAPGSSSNGRMKGSGPPAVSIMHFLKGTGVVSLAFVSPAWQWDFSAQTR